jgi:aminoglycoside 2''-phosphotransferase
MPIVQDQVTQINRAYPELHIHSARQITASGQFSQVIIINDSLIFRFPRSPYVAQGMTREVRILRAVKGSLSLPIPDPSYTYTDPESDTVLFMGYTMLAGEPMSANILVHQPEAVVQGLAKQLADFLRELHAIPPISLNIDLPSEGTHDDWLRLYQAIREQLFPFMRPDAQVQVSANFETALNDLVLWRFTPVLCHGDFGTRNILYDPQTMRITGIIDFGSCGLGDPAQDVGAVWSLGDNLMPHLLAYYPEMQATLSRVKFIRSTYALQQALYALRDGNQNDFEDGLRGYRADS